MRRTDSKSNQTGANNGAGGVLDSLVHRQDERTSLCGGSQRVDLHQRRLPHSSLEVVGNILVEDIDAEPGATLSVLLAQLVEDVCGVEAGIVAQVAGNALKRLSNHQNHWYMKPSRQTRGNSTLA